MVPDLLITGYSPKWSPDQMNVLYHMYISNYKWSSRNNEIADQKQL